MTPVSLIEGIPPAVADPPALWQVELTNHCPYVCVGCPRPHMKRPLGMMDFATFRTCIREVEEVQKQIRPLGLHHFGESLLHPELPRFVAHASERGVPTWLACNPGHLSPRLGEELLQAGLSRIVFSLDALDTPTLQLLRGRVANYDRAEQHIRHFLDVRDCLNAACEVRIQMIAYEANRDQWEAFKAKWQRPDVYVYVKAFDSWTMPELQELGAEAMQVRCTFPFLFAVVLWDGRIVPCCHDHDAEVVLGSIHDGLLTVWQGKAYRRFREQFQERTLPQAHLCRRCAWWPGQQQAGRLGLTQLSSLERE